MLASSIDRETLSHLGRLLEYPSPDFDTQLRDAQEALTEISAPAAAELQLFHDVISEWGAEKLEEAYTRAFDVAPQCIPYLSVFLFGQESFKRAELMAGLKERYAATGCDCGNELPDHIAVVLRFATLFTDEEWSELRHWCIPGPLSEMIRGLTKASNPYVHILRAAELAMSAHAVPGGA